MARKWNRIKSALDVRSYEEQEETLALLKILALGNREIEQGHFLSAKDVFAELDKEDAQSNNENVLLSPLFRISPREK